LLFTRAIVTLLFSGALEDSCACGKALQPALQSGVFLPEINKRKRLLHLMLIGVVHKRELEQAYAEVVSLVAELPPGFHVLTDLTHLQSMDTDCEAEIARLMELCAGRGIESVVRVIPEPQKDIGFNILSALHYRREIRVTTWPSLEQALQTLFTR
jgi:ABC-type transporter Mla MlaB component